MGAFKGSEMHEAVIEFDAWGADDVRGRTWHGSQKLTDRPDGTLKVTMRLNSLEEISRWVLTFGEHATVVAPNELKERLKRSARAVEAKY
jgi:predicted DNA-binding transcriptional regulator YafY